MLVETVVDDLPPEPLAQLPRERCPEGCLDDHGGLVKLVLLARRFEGVECQPERLALELPVARVLAPNSGDGQERDALCHAGRLFRLSRARERPVEHALASARQGFRKLLRSLAPIRPGDHREKQNVRTAGLRLARVELETRDLDLRFPDSEQALRRESSPDGAPPVQRKEAAPERVEASAPPLLPLGSHGASPSRVRRLLSRDASLLPTASGA